MLLLRRGKALPRGWMVPLPRQRASLLRTLLQPPLFISKSPPLRLCVPIPSTPPLRHLPQHVMRTKIYFLHFLNIQFKFQSERAQNGRLLSLLCPIVSRRVPGASGPGAAAAGHDPQRQPREAEPPRPPPPRPARGDPYPADSRDSANVEKVSKCCHVVESSNAAE